MIRDDMQYFWNEWANGTLVLQRCDACGASRFYPAPLCPVCSSDSFAWHAGSGSGAVHSFTRVTGRESEGDSTVVLVELSDAVRVLGVLDEPDAAVAIGAEVAIAPTGDAHGPIRFALA